eukprot:CAMPEP_0181066580 /NCGR_PEP_ID=MMETSP1070-20121207/25409_1 /TAXON_ID=265543 /ORGANISM="Minutocellus polymorphus, Strain NH13" /LENGTH=289 /DNA_ID=CAMNT_0023147169 /DNA_START=21 /DNA_END=890 /DNA_ORIENTATION=+
MFASKVIALPSSGSLGDNSPSAENPAVKRISCHSACSLDGDDEKVVMGTTIKLSISSGDSESSEDGDRAPGQSRPLPSRLVRRPPPRSILRTVSSYGSEENISSADSATTDQGIPISTTNKARFCRNVSFASVGIREYSQTLGDHPNVSYGPPLSLDWNYSNEVTLDFETYEAERPPRRSARGMMQNYYQRRDILLCHGHTEEELKRSKKLVEKAKMKRSVTRYFLPVRHIEDALTSAGRKARRVVSKDVKDERAREKDYLRSSLGLPSSFSRQFSATPPPFSSRRSSV